MGGGGGRAQQNRVERYTVSRLERDGRAGWRKGKRKRKRNRVEWMGVCVCVTGREKKEKKVEFCERVEWNEWREWMGGVGGWRSVVWSPPLVYQRLYKGEVRSIAW